MSDIKCKIGESVYTAVARETGLLSNQFMVDIRCAYGSYIHYKRGTKTEAPVGFHYGGLVESRGGGMFVWFKKNPVIVVDNHDVGLHTVEMELGEDGVRVIGVYSGRQNLTTSTTRWNYVIPAASIEDARTLALMFYSNTLLVEDEKRVSVYNEA